MPIRTRAAMLLALALLLGSCIFAPTFARAGGPLQVLDVELGGEAEHFAMHRWQGRPAVSAFTVRRPAEGAAPAPPVLALDVLVLDGVGWRHVGHWPLPLQTRAVEPLRLPDGLSGWLLLVGSQWQLALPQGEALALRPLCPCDTIYSHGGHPDADDHFFVVDLDGDGTDEVLLPYSGHLEAYRISPLLLALEPLWRVPWHPDGTPLPRAENPADGFQLPRFDVVDVDGDGRKELLMVERERVLVAPLPDPRAPASLSLDGPRRALLERRMAAAPPPESLAAALRRVGTRRFTSADAFLKALVQGVPTVQSDLWAPHLLAVLALARSEVAVVTPYAVPLAGLGRFGDKDHWLVLGRADMDGDGVLDLLHAKLIDYRSVLSQQNELRWYRGRFENGRLTFAPPTDAIRSDAGSFAELVRLRTTGVPPLALLLATAEVSLSSVMQALASQSVTLQARVLTWHEGALAPQPLAANEFTYTELRAEGRRAMFLFADLNGDGWRDPVLNTRDGEVGVYLSQGAVAGLQKPSFVQSDLRLPSRPNRVLIADVDGDGREELVLRYRERYQGALGTKLRLVRLPAP